MNAIKIGDVEMPLTDFVVSRNAILGITKSGKTFTAKGVAEQLMEAKVPIMVFDAIGMWRWLKVPSGKRGGKGFPIVVAGGAQPDLPLTPHTAPQIVRAAIQQNISLVIDLYDPKLSKADWRRIVQDCFRILLFENKGLRHIFLEEAAEYVPQKVMDGQTYAEVEKLARMGGNASLGITLINPRAQELNKAVLELCDNIVLLRQRGTHAIDSLEKQMDKLSPEMAKEIALTMPNMTQGDCWVFTENGDRPTRTRSIQIKSFHPDRRNPELNKEMGDPVNTDQFVTALSGKLEKVIAEAKANDPSELRKLLDASNRRGNELELKLGKALKSTKSEVVETRIEPALTDADRKHISKLASEIELHELSVRQNADRLESSMAEFRKEITSLVQRIKPANQPRVSVKEARIQIITSPMGSGDSGDVSPTGQKILNALAELDLLSVSEPVREMVALMAGYTNLASTGYVKAIGELKGAGLVRYPNSETIAFTESGRGVAKYPDSPRTSEEIQTRVCHLIGGKAAEILKPLIDAYPNKVSRMDVAQASGYTNLASTGFVKSVGRLRKLGFVDYPDSDTMIATSVLFLK